MDAANPLASVISSRHTLLIAGPLALPLPEFNSPGEERTMHRQGGFLASVVSAESHHTQHLLFCLFLQFAILHFKHRQFFRLCNEIAWFWCRNFPRDVHSPPFRYLEKAVCRLLPIHRYRLDLRTQTQHSLKRSCSMTYEGMDAHRSLGMLLVGINVSHVPSSKRMVLSDVKEEGSNQQ